MESYTSIAPGYESVDSTREAYVEPKEYCPSCCTWVQLAGKDDCPLCKWGLR